MARIFVSYSRADRQFVDEFVPLLRRVYGNDSVWFDDDIPGGHAWWQIILNEIAQCDLFVYLLSTEALASPYCQAEFKEAVRLKKLVLPVIARPKTQLADTLPADIRQALRQTQWVDLSRGFNDPQANAALYAAINRLLGQASPSSAMPLADEPVSEPPVSDKSARRFRLTTSGLTIIAIIIGFTGVFVIALLYLVSNQAPPVTLTSTIESATRPTESPLPEPTSTKTITVTTSPTITVTPTDTISPTASIAPTSTLTLSGTEYELTIQFLITEVLTEAARVAQTNEAATEIAATSFGHGTASALTATATLWTPTPTPDTRATALQRLTQTQQAVILSATNDAIATETRYTVDLTATATLWTATPSPTHTPTATRVPTNTPPRATEFVFPPVSLVSFKDACGDQPLTGGETVHTCYGYFYFKVALKFDEQQFRSVDWCPDRRYWLQIQAGDFITDRTTSVNLEIPRTVRIGYSPDGLSGKVARINHAFVCFEINGVQRDTTIPINVDVRFEN